MNTKIEAQQGSTIGVASGPRLVKADAVAARQAEQAARAVRRAASKIKENGVNPVLKRTPRNAMEARDMFKALFNEAA